MQFLTEENQIQLSVSIIIFLLSAPPHVAEHIYNIFVIQKCMLCKALMDESIED